MAKNPIVLSGKVYVGEYLAPHYPERKLPAQLNPGDIKVDSHLDARGRANREAKTAKARKRGYSGYFTGVIWDGDAWRRFKIANIVGSDGYYSTQRWKRDKIHGVFWSLESVAGRVAIVGDGTYELSPAKAEVVEAAVVAAPPAPPSPAPVVAPEPPEKQAAPDAKPVQLSLF